MEAYQNMLEKKANLDVMMQKVANYDEELKAAKKSAKKEYKANKKEIKDEFSALRKGTGVAGAGAHMLARGVEAAKGGRKFGVGAVTKALGTGGLAHAGATVATSAPKNRGIREAKKEAYQNV